MFCDDHESQVTVTSVTAERQTYHSSVSYYLNVFTILKCSHI